MSITEYGHSVKVKTEPEQPVTEQDVLNRAADLLEEFGWCQGSFSLDKNGYAVFPWQPEAQSFCAVGAILRAGRELNHREVLSDGEAGDVMCWNDQGGRSREAVVLALRAGLPQFRSI